MEQIYQVVSGLFHCLFQADNSLPPTNLDSTGRAPSFPLADKERLTREVFERNVHVERDERKGHCLFASARTYRYDERWEPGVTRGREPGVSTKQASL